MTDPVTPSLFEADAPVARPVFGNMETRGDAGKLRRYATYLRPDQVEAIKRRTIQARLRGALAPDYRLVQDAIDEYLARHPHS
ncbi:hypothetical protein CcI6DRAFT_02883 [Frankia sp. CcI6]|uniref:hypothetical protein n=1 Tax=unclassified Frankia TaxID=2632575 RepID=UPI0003CFCF54|nr:MULTISPECIES: hypothetical protein [unclassified Frankia]ETA01703.1 hypothetical protein CcI6DRAFT_02883 [Frankia sp. CcI6]